MSEVERRDPESFNQWKWTKGLQEPWAVLGVTSRQVGTEGKPGQPCLFPAAWASVLQECRAAEGMKDCSCSMVWGWSSALTWEAEPPFCGWSQAEAWKAMALDLPWQVCCGWAADPLPHGKNLMWSPMARRYRSPQTWEMNILGRACLHLCPRFCKPCPGTAYPGYGGSDLHSWASGWARRQQLPQSLHPPYPGTAPLSPLCYVTKATKGACVTSLHCLSLKKIQC